MHNIQPNIKWGKSTSQEGRWGWHVKCWHHVCEPKEYMCSCLFNGGEGPRTHLQYKNLKAWKYTFQEGNAGDICSGTMSVGWQHTCAQHCHMVPGNICARNFNFLKLNLGVFFKKILHTKLTYFMLKLLRLYKSNFQFIFFVFVSFM